MNCREKEKLQQEVKAQENEMISAKDDVQVPITPVHTGSWHFATCIPHFTFLTLTLHISSHPTHSHPSLSSHMSSHTTPHLTLTLASSPCLTPHCDPTPHMHPLPLSQVLKNSLQESQARCQELGAEKNEAQAKLDQLNAEKTSIEQQLVEAKRSVEEAKVAVSMLRTLQPTLALKCHDCCNPCRAAYYRWSC